MFDPDPLRILVLASIAGAAGSLGLRTSGDPAPEPPLRIALLVGIDEYAPGTSREFPNLSGCVNDVERVRDLLVSRFRHAPEDVRTLVNAEATHQAIVETFHSWLIERAGPGTEVLFWFSGHGSRIPDGSQQETENQDSTFLAYDSRMGERSGEYDISDDEIRSLLYALTRKTSRVTVITDACHSGGGVRGASGRLGKARAAPPGVRELDWDALASFWPESVPRLDDDDSRVPDPGSYVHIAACSPRQVAREIHLDEEGEETAVLGALSFFVTDTLERMQPRTSYRRLADQVTVRLSTWYPGQTVWYEGAVDREVFGNRFDSRPPGFLGRPDPRLDDQDDPGESAADTPPTLRLDGGAAHLLRKGSMFEVLDNQTGAHLGTAELDNLGATQSRARWVEGPPGGVEFEVVRAIETSRPMGQEPLRVHCADSSWAERLERSGYATCVDREHAEYEIVAQARLGSPVTLRDGSGIAIWPGEALSEEVIEAGEDGIFASLEEGLREELVWRALFHLAQQTGSIQVDLTFRNPTEEEKEHYGFESADIAPSSEGTGRPGAGRSAGRELTAHGGAHPDYRLGILEFRNDQDRPLHVVVLSISEDRGRELLWPVEGSRQNVLQPGQKEEVAVGIVLPEAWSLERPLRDRYLAVATESFADFSMFRRRALLRSGGTSSDAPLPGPVERALSEPITRGIRRRVRKQTPDWGISCLDLLVSP